MLGYEEDDCCALARLQFDGLEPDFREVAHAYMDPRSFVDKDIELLVKHAREKGKTAILAIVTPYEVKWIPFFKKHKFHVLTKIGRNRNNGLKGQLTFMLRKLNSSPEKKKSTLPPSRSSIPTLR